MDFIHTAQTTGGVLAALAILFGIIIAILPIVLFFKIWCMTNDVEKIKLLLEQRESYQHKEQGPDIYPEEKLQQPEMIKTKSTFWRVDKIPFKREVQNTPVDSTAKNTSTQDF